MTTEATIHINCPQCGADIDFLEEIHVIKCEYCGSVLLVAGRSDVLRYVIPPRIEKEEILLEKIRSVQADLGRIESLIETVTLFYAPYWRFQGVSYQWMFGTKTVRDRTDDWTGVTYQEDVKELSSRVLDHTFCGFDGPDIGLSNLGVRSQAMYLEPFNKAHLLNRHAFLPLDLPLDSVKAEAKRASKAFFREVDITPQAILSCFIRSRFSVIYFPIVCVQCKNGDAVEWFLLDGLTGNLLKQTEDASVIRTKLESDKSRKSFKFGEIRFLPFKCPNCGWEFPYRPLSILHFCPVCLHLYREKKGEWIETPYYAAPAPDNHNSDPLLWVPFWRFRAAMTSPVSSIKSMADLYELAPPIRVIDKEAEAKRPIYFYMPAIRFRNPKAAHTLGSRLTFRQPAFTKDLFPEGYRPLTPGGNLTVADAHELGPIILGEMIPPKSRKSRKWMTNCEVKLQKPSIIYFPFIKHRLIWRDPVNGVSFQSNALAEDIPEIPR